MTTAAGLHLFNFCFRFLDILVLIRHFPGSRIGVEHTSAWHLW